MTVYEPYHEPCPQCGGEGQREHITAVPDWNDPTGQTAMPSLMIEECDVCLGMGYPCVQPGGTIKCVCKYKGLA
jgi:hypothetical protein